MTHSRTMEQRSVLTKPLRLIESALLLPRWRSDQPQLFILGLPRSGTTLVYQYIVHRLRVSYFTSAVARYPRSACLVTAWERARRGGYHSDFRSNYGEASGPAAPQEARRFWGGLFGYNDYVSLAGVQGSKARRLQRVIACLQRLDGNTPFVNKNVKHMLRLDALAALFPTASFLVVSRDLPDVALSILRGRHANMGSSSAWWSIRPPDYERLRALPPPAQVARQVLSLQKRMEEDLARLPAARVLRVHYREFCARPESLIEFLRNRWTPAELRHEPEARFDFKSNHPRTDEERELLRELEQ